MTADSILISGAREHNLKDVTVELPRNALIVLTGLSGSGKSSLAFDTIYAEGQRRYVESLSAYARQFLGQMDKPDVDFIEGLSPAISIDQKTASRNPRSTVGTVTEVHDYLRLLFARIGIPHCPNDGEVVKRQTPQQIVDRILEMDDGMRFMVLAPVVEGRKGEYQALFKDLVRQGYSRARIDGEVLPLDEEIRLDRYYQHTIEVVVDRLVRREGVEDRLTQSIETALGLAEGKAMVDVIDGPTLSFSQHLACDRCGLSFSELAPRNFSFNSPYGACSTCAGIGARYQVAEDLVVPNDRLSVMEGAIAAWAYQYSGYYTRLLDALAEDMGFSLQTPWRELSEPVREEILHGNFRRQLRVSYRNRRGRRRVWSTRYEGVIPHLERRHRDTRLRLRPGFLPPVHAAGPLRRVRRRPAGRDLPGGDGGGCEHPSSLGALFGRCVGLHRPPRAHRPGDDHRRAGAEGGPLPDVLPSGCGAGLSHPGQVGGHPGRRGGAADPAGHPDRLGAGGGALHPRRAVHRPAPARTTAA